MNMKKEIVKIRMEKKKFLHPFKMSRYSVLLSTVFHKWIRGLQEMLASVYKFFSVFEYRFYFLLLIKKNIYIWLTDDVHD